MSPIKNLIILLLLSSSLWSQDFVPIVKQFTKSDYIAANQNWSVVQGKDGMMYFGNNNGLLQFDGNRWKLYKLPQDKTVRSLMVDDDGRIYAGSFQEFGYFEKNDAGTPVYHSLSALVKDFKFQNDEIWSIAKLNGKIYFQFFASYFVYDGETVQSYRPPLNMFFFHVSGSRLLSYVDQLGYSRYDEAGSVFKSLGISGLKSRVLNSFPRTKDSNLLVTETDGLFILKSGVLSRFSTQADAELSSAKINKAVLDNQGNVYLGTILNGLYAIDSKGKLLWHINRKNVLLNNTILGMGLDVQGNLWLGMDKGIAMVRTDSKLMYLNSFENTIGSIYDAEAIGNRIYLATNQGLYSASANWDKPELFQTSLLSPMRGQVWDLYKEDNQILCGYNEKTYEISGSNVSEMRGTKGGGMCVTKGKIYGKEVLIQGTYTHLCVYQKEKGVWKFSHALAGFVNPISYLQIDYAGRIWAAHLYQGMYCIQLSPDLKKIEKMDKYESLDGVNKYKIRTYQLNNRVLFTDHRRFYTFDDLNKKIIPFDDLNRKLGYFAGSYRICPFGDKYSWFVNDKESALYEVVRDTIRLMDVLPISFFGNKTVDGYQNFIPLDNNRCLITLENGLALYNLSNTIAKKVHSDLQLKAVVSIDDKIQDEEYLPLSEVLVKIPFSSNHLSFSVFLPDYEMMNDLLYSFRLEGLDNKWSKIENSGERTYTYLPAGKYVFHARVFSGRGNQISQLDYSFEILQPFYWTIAARIVYMILLLVVFWLIFMRIRLVYHRKHEKMKEQEEALRMREIEKREQQIMLLEKEKLTAELTLKSKELAQSTMTIINKNEILTQLKQELNDQKLKLGAQYPKKYFDKIMSMINENLSSEEDWIRFQSNFDMIHQNFFRNLHRDFPELTSNDLRFCAYLRLNLPSKDIANLLNITLKGVEVARYRIRKKINLESSKSLTEFMIEYK